MNLLYLSIEQFDRRQSPWELFFGRLSSFVLFVFFAGLILWSAGALCFDFPVRWMRVPLFFLWLCLLIPLSFQLVKRNRLNAFAIAGIPFLIVLAGWSFLQPSNDRTWRPDVEKTAWAEIAGDKITVHNVRNFDYKAGGETAAANWEERSYDLSTIRNVDLFINYWGSPLMAHPILSFEFANRNRLCFSIESRRERGEEYNALAGLFRKYELIYVAGDERDLVRVRTNFRKGEDLYLYRLKMPVDQIRTTFLEYIARLNQLHGHPEFYNAISSNCTTNIRSQSQEREPWDWRILVNGYMDRMLFERGRFEGNLPFEELKKRAHINDSALLAGDSPDFSDQIRTNRPGFSNDQTAGK